MRAVLVDDDSSMRDTLKTLLHIYTPEVEIVGEASSVKDGVNTIKQLKPDLVLLDVELTDGTGFDLMSIYGEVDFKVIFVTGHDEYAIKAFKYSAIDYVLKPIDPEDLISAIKKFDLADHPQEPSLKMKALMYNQEQRSERDKKVVLRDANSIYLVDIGEIIRCQSDANYTRFHLKDGRSILVSKTLKEYDQLFKSDFFFRVHQSHLINLHHFDHFEKADGGTIYMKDGSALPVAVRKKEQLIAALEKL